MDQTKKDPLLKKLDRTAKRCLVKIILWVIGKLPVREKFTGPLDSIVILAQEKIGDAILLTPFIKILRHSLPSVKIHAVAVTSTVYDFFKNDPNVDFVYWVKASYPRYFRTMAKLKFDLLFSTKDHPSFTFLYQTRLLAARYRVGIDHPYHDGFFNHVIKLEFHQHIIEKNCSLLNYLGIPYSKKDCRPYLPEQPISAEVAGLALRLSTEKPIGINLSAGEKDREWPVDKWRQFLARVRQPVIIFAMPGRLDDKHQLEKEFSQVIPSPDTTVLYEAGWLICQLLALVTPDTALVHVASCFNVPVLGLYRADVDHITRFYPYLVRYKTIMSPTYKIEDIPVDQVIHGLQELLDNQPIP
jgi:heptosyltransferase III